MDSADKCYTVLILDDDEDDNSLLSLELKDHWSESTAHFFSKANDLLTFYQAKKQNFSPILILLNVFTTESGTQMT